MSFKVEISILFVLLGLTLATARMLEGISLGTVLN
jgi:hypothetical protein